MVHPCPVQNANVFYHARNPTYFSNLPLTSRVLRTTMAV